VGFSTLHSANYRSHVGRDATCIQVSEREAPLGPRPPQGLPRSQVSRHRQGHLLYMDLFICVSSVAGELRGRRALGLADPRFYAFEFDSQTVQALMTPDIQLLSCLGGLEPELGG